jgi:hypothetical protein
VLSPYCGKNKKNSKEGTRGFCEGEGGLYTKWNQGRPKLKMKEMEAIKYRYTRKGNATTIVE